MADVDQEAHLVLGDLLPVAVEFPLHAELLAAQEPEEEAQNQPRRSEDPQRREPSAPVPRGIDHASQYGFPRGPLSACGVAGRLDDVVPRHEVPQHQFGIVGVEFLLVAVSGDAEPVEAFAEEVVLLHPDPDDERLVGPGDPELLVGGSVGGPFAVQNGVHQSDVGGVRRGRRVDGAHVEQPSGSAQIDAAVAGREARLRLEFVPCVLFRLAERDEAPDVGQPDEDAVVGPGPDPSPGVADDGLQRPEEGGRDLLAARRSGLSEEDALVGGDPEGALRSARDAVDERILPGSEKGLDPVRTEFRFVDVPLVVEVAFPVFMRDREAGMEPIRRFEPFHASRARMVAVRGFGEEQNGAVALPQQVHRLPAVRRLIAEQAVFAIQGGEASGSFVERVKTLREDRQQELLPRKSCNRGDLVSEGRRIVGEAFGAGIEAVDAAAVGADPYLFGPRFLVEAEYRFGAQPVGAHRLRADMDLHVRFADDDQAAADPSGPDRAVRIAVERADGVARQGVRVSGQVFQYRDPLRLRVEDVDAAAVGADPDFALLLGHAENHVVAQCRVPGVVDRDPTPFRIETLDAPVVGREPYPAL